MKMTQEELKLLEEKYSNMIKTEIKNCFQITKETEELCKMNKELNYMYDFVQVGNLIDVESLKVLMRYGYVMVNGIYTHDNELHFIHKSKIENK